MIDSGSLFGYLIVDVTDRGSLFGYLIVVDMIDRGYLII